jgi:hypothetical protein
MAFEQKELSLMAYSGAGTGGHRFYFYTNSESDNVAAAGFFDNAAEQVGVGDVILDVDGAVMYTVASITEGVVAVAAMFATPGG